MNSCYEKSSGSVQTVQYKTKSFILKFWHYLHCLSVTVPNVNILLHIFATLPVATAPPKRVLSKVEKTASTSARASINEDRPEVLVLIQTQRDKTPSIDAVIDILAVNTMSSSRCFVLSLGGSQNFSFS